MKACSTCEKEYPATVEYFHSRKSSKDGLRHQCNKCQRPHIRKAQAKHDQIPKRKADKKRNSCKHEYLSKRKDYKRRYYLKHTYNIALADYDEMLERQKGVCAICGGLNSAGQRLCVDHDHATGEVRGLLCHGCNTRLGWYEKNKLNTDLYLKGKLCLILI